MSKRNLSICLVLAWSLSATLLSAQMSGQIVVDYRDPSWFRYHEGGSFFLCAPGNPEGFLYRGTINPNGTRNGDQVGLLTKLAPTGANGIYRFEHHKHLIWVVAEEYDEVWSTAEASQLSQIIRAADDHNHPIAVHQSSGLSFDFPTDPNVDQFAIQHDETNSDSVNADMVTAWNDAAGRYNLNLSEAHDWGTGVVARRNGWAAAMGGANVMHLDWDIVGTPVARLEECGALRTFFETVDLAGMSPENALGYQSTSFVLALRGERYIAYARQAGSIGIRDLPEGKPIQRWLDTVTGTVIELRESIAGGDTLLIRPGGIGNEAVVALIYDPIFW